jgi:pyrroline-5-carboxylate reductase
LIKNKENLLKVKDSKHLFKPKNVHRSKKITFLGSGRIARALIEGLLKTGSVAPEEILVTSQHGTSAERLAQEWGVAAIATNHEAIEASSIVILCTKPAQALATVAASHKSLAHKLLVSMAAGIRSDDLFEASSRSARIIRAMPNTAVRIGKGTVSLAPHLSATQEDLLLVKKIFSKSASIEEVTEEQIDAVTALSGSGPAFALLFLEALLDAGLQAGLDQALSRSLAAHTLEAAAALVLQTTTSPQALREEITSPHGTTAAGLRILEEAGWKRTIERAVEAARQRARELAGEV